MHIGDTSGHLAAGANGLSTQPLKRAFTARENHITHRHTQTHIQTHTHKQTHIQTHTHTQTHTSALQYRRTSQAEHATKYSPPVKHVPAGAVELPGRIACYNRHAELQRVGSYR